MITLGGDLKPLRIYSAVWGKYVDWFERGTVASLMWPKNRLELQRATWVIVTLPQDIPRLKEILGKTNVAKYEFVEIPEDADSKDSYNAVHLWAFVYEIDRCLTENASLIMAPPDIIFGEGTIPTLCAIGAEPNNVVCVPHVRVLDSFIDNDDWARKDAWSNPELVSRAFDYHLHDSWIYSEHGQRESCSFIGGVSWKELGFGMMSVTHLLPAPFFCNFIPSDLSYFMRQKFFGSIDHEWPGQLCKQNRERVIGSSNAAFIVEITQANRNMPQLLPGNKHDPSGFCKEHFHNQVNRAFTCIWEGKQ
jgi:hypothetical protein